MSFFLVFLFFGFLVFFLYNVHYLILLLSVELVLLVLVFFLCVGWCEGVGLAGTFFFFLLMACMGAFSVSLLVSLFRGMGRDFWFSGSIL